MATKHIFEKASHDVSNDLSKIEKKIGQVIQSQMKAARSTQGLFQYHFKVQKACENIENITKNPITHEVSNENSTPRPR